MLKNTHKEATFASILADGKIHVTVPEGTEGAVIRTYETSDGTKGSKTELVYTELSGIITKMKFVEGDYGNQLFITVEDSADEKPVVLALNVSSNFAEDYMKKSFNLDMAKPVVIAPYAFVDEKGKSKKGISLSQDGKKIDNYFYDKEKKTTVNGYPEALKSKKKGGVVQPPSKDEWKVWFMNCRIFLVDKMNEHFKLDEPGGFGDFDKSTVSVEPMPAYPVSDDTNNGDGFDLVMPVIR